MNRRRFLALAAGAGGLAALAPWRSLQRAERKSHALGTKVSLVAYHENRATAEAAIDASFAALDGIEDVMSLYRPGSELRRLNRDGLLDRPHRDLVTVLTAAVDWSRRTGGAFDPTVQPLWESNDPHPLIDWRKVDVDTHHIRLAPGMAVTLNGIAQGFAADRVREVLRAHGVRQALADTGEIAGIGRPWRIGIQHPRLPDAYVALAEIEDRVMATSGDYATTSTRHIVDPATLRTPETLSSVTILAPTGLEADALSTAVFVLGPDKGMELIASRPGVDALLILKDGTSISTPKFPEVRA